MEARNRPLPHWLTRIQTRQIKLPRFQRFEAWSHHNVTALLNSVLRGLPVGAVLVLAVDGEEPFASRPVRGAPAEGERVSEHLLDGQQRLTALWRALHDGYEDRSFYVDTQPDDESGEPFRVVSRARWQKDGKRYPLWLDDPVALWKQRLLPVRLLRPDETAEGDLDVWLEEAAEGEHSVEKEIGREARRLRSLVGAFNLPFLSLPASTPRDTALNVFIQMNTSAAPLTAFDVVVAQVEATTGESLHGLESDLRAAVPAVASYVNPADLLLQVAALLQDLTPTRKSFLERHFSPRLVEDRDRIQAGVRRAVAFLEEERVFDGPRLPTNVVLAPLAALWADAPQGGDAEGEARMVLRRYLWRAFFTERYEKTSATRALVDFRELRALMAGGPDAALPAVLDEAQFPLPSDEAFRSAGWPVRTERLARALLALSLRAGGLDLADGSAVSRVGLAGREYHHLFPVALLKERGTADWLIHRALNCALVTWKTNRTMAAKSPERYLAERRDGTSLGEEEVRRRLASHLVPYDELAAGSYETFLDARALLMHGAMVQACSGM